MVTSALSASSVTLAAASDHINHTISSPLSWFFPQLNLLTQIRYRASTTAPLSRGFPEGSLLGPNPLYIPFGYSIYCQSLVFSSRAMMFSPPSECVSTASLTNCLKKWNHTTNYYKYKHKPLVQQYEANWKVLQFIRCPLVTDYKSQEILIFLMLRCQFMFTDWLKNEFGRNDSFFICKCCGCWIFYIYVNFLYITEISKPWAMQMFSGVTRLT